MRVDILPNGAVRPADKRLITGKYAGTEKGKGKKPLPVGISDFVRAQSEYYYVDKTLLIKELKEIIKFGIAFSGKKLKVRMK